MAMLALVPVVTAVGIGILAALMAAGPARSQQSQGQAQTQTQQPTDQKEDQQKPDQKPDISVDVKLVNVFATVRDKKGAIVNNLTKNDFMLEEDGRPQTIQYFAQESNLPLTLGLLVDTSMSQRTVLSQERTASYAFLDHMLREEKDKAFVIHFDTQVELLQDLTPSREKLEQALQLLQTSDPDDNGGNGGGSGGGQSGGQGGPGGGSGGGRGRHGGGGAGTLLYDSIYLASNEVMKALQGRKALVVLTDGVDHGSKESLETSIESAQRADTLVYSILFAGEEPHMSRGGFGGPRMGGGWPGGGGGWPGGGGGGGRRGGYPSEQRPDGKKVLTQLSQETGGQMYEVSKKESIDEIYARIEDGLRHQYVLGYTPDKPEPGYHKIHVTVKNKDLAVQARESYYAK
jgi:VWFA-related protein